MIVTLLAAGLLVLQSPRVQTRLTAGLLERFTADSDADIRFSSLRLLPFNAVELKDMVILDRDSDHSGPGEVQDTLAYARRIIATFSIRGLVRNEGLHIRRLVLRDGGFNYVIEDRPEYPDYKDNLSRMFKLLPSDKEKSKADIFDLKTGRIDNFRFRLINNSVPNDRYTGVGINWSDIDLVASVKVKGMKFSGGVMSGLLEEAEIAEKCGYKVKRLTGSVRVGNGRTIVDNLRLVDDWSDIRMSRFTMDHKDKDSFRHFLDKVALGASLEPSRVSFSTIKHFAGKALDENPVTLDIRTADIHGPVRDMRITNLAFNDAWSGLDGTLTGRISGLPDVNQMLLDLRGSGLSFTTEGMIDFIKAWAKGTSINLGKIARGQHFAMDADIHGTLDALDVKADIRNGGGSLDAAIRLGHLLDRSKPIEIGGRVSTKELELGRILDVKALGDCNLGARFQASLPAGAPQVRLDSLHISKLGLLEYDYQDIMAAGTFSQNAFDGRIICSDPNLHFMVQGLFNLSRKTRNAAYDFYGFLGLADLNALKIDQRQPSRVSLGSVKANYIRTVKGDLLGNIDARGLTLEGTDGTHDIGNISVSSHSNDNVHRIKFTSSFADASYVATQPVSSLLRDLVSLTSARELPALYSKPQAGKVSDDYEIGVNFHNSTALLSFVAPGVYVADSSNVRFHISRDGRLDGDIKSSRLAFKDKYLRNLRCHIDNTDDALNSKIIASEVRLGRDLAFSDNTMLLYANDNHIGMRYLFDNHADTESSGELNLIGELSRDEADSLVIAARTLASNFSIGSSEFSINPGTIQLRGREIHIDGISIENGDQNISIDGGLSPYRSDELQVKLSRVDCGLIETIMGGSVALDGLLSGEAKVLSPTGNGGLGFSARMVCDSTSISSYNAGTVRIAADLDNQSHKLAFRLRNVMGSQSTIDASGSYDMGGKTVTANANLNGFNIGYASSLLTSVFSELSGELSGSVKVDGHLGDLDIRSEGMRLGNGLLKVGYTNVPYHLDGDISIDKEGVHFDKVGIRDDHRGSGNVTGGILFNHFKDIEFDTHMAVENMEAFNTDATSGEPIYGNFFATGRVNITGPLSALTLEVDATTAREGSIHIPLSGVTGSSKKSNILEFKEPEVVRYVDPYEEMMKTITTQARKSSEVKFKFKVIANQGTQAVLELDRESGNVLAGRGSGDINIDLNPSRNIFNIGGDYTLENGDFTFNALGLVSKNFSISSGSSIKFNGDIMDSDLDIKALYSLKTSLSKLIADSTSTRRLVNCGINISDKLRNPRLGFTIDVPDLDPTTTALVESALNTDDKVQKQFVALLITSNFLPDEQSGIVNTNSLLYSNVTDIMASQLSNILQKLGIPLDLGLKYQSTQSGTNIFDVAVSTQLFNNRVIVNGTIGNRNHLNQTSATTSDVVGDLDIEIKLDNAGQVRLTLFSHSADAYTNYLDNSQRNGAGIAYQREFNTFGDFLRELFASKKKRQEMEIRRALTKEENVTISIE